MKIWSTETIPKLLSLFRCAVNFWVELRAYANGLAVIRYIPQTFISLLNDEVITGKKNEV
jgi:hypothetical protein